MRSLRHTLIEGDDRVRIKEFAYLANLLLRWENQLCRVTTSSSNAVVINSTSNRTDPEEFSSEFSAFKQQFSPEFVKTLFATSTNRRTVGVNARTRSTHSTGPSSTPAVGGASSTNGVDTGSLGRQQQTRKLLHRDEEDTVRLFLCPFYVKEKHIFHQCSKRRFKRTSDVRQHICRVHIQALHCPNCGKIFENDLPHERLNEHIAVRTCQMRPFIIPGITVEQFDRITAVSISRNRHLSALGRWLQMWRVIFDGVPDPDSPYDSGQRNSVLGMLDTRAAMENDQWQALSSGTPLENLRPNELSVIDTSIDPAREIQRGESGATTVLDSTQTSLATLELTQTVQDHSTSVTSSRLIQPPATQEGDSELAANTLAPAPPLARSSDSWDPDWAAFIDEGYEGLSQSLDNQVLSWDVSLERFNYSWE